MKIFGVFFQSLRRFEKVLFIVGDWSSWLKYFLAAVRDTAGAAIHRSQAILELRDELRPRFAKDLRALALLDMLFVNPYANVARAADFLGVTAPTASKTIKSLEQAGILSEVTGRDWGRLWVARPILSAAQS